LNSTLAFSPIVTTTDIDQQIAIALIKAKTISTDCEGLVTKIFAQAKPISPPEIPLRNNVRNPTK